jgi:hypothetical protein
MVSHLIALANALSTLLAVGEKFLAVGFQHTSVSDESWLVYNPETEDQDPYNMLTGEDHAFVDVWKPEATPPVETPAPPS